MADGCPYVEMLDAPDYLYHFLSTLYDGISSSRGPSSFHEVVPHLINNVSNASRLTSLLIKTEAFCSYQQLFSQTIHTPSYPHHFLDILPTALYDLSR
ncbi:hypothetical protein BDP27DRAFT_1319373 [Rhodocollybia butyracea]|uniref:Uncharacterized protein n=1 Tax=Rhodocollybia butyracea TaxID=206335 RepID=A0A9P5UBH3_9AGAR|nr:hypothetical protein BDP27DRAFT_1319373 [Rhodocollybia butyracea]